MSGTSWQLRQVQCAFGAHVVFAVIRGEAGRHMQRNYWKANSHKGTFIHWPFYCISRSTVKPVADQVLASSKSLGRETLQPRDFSPHERREIARKLMEWAPYNYTTQLQQVHHYLHQRNLTKPNVIYVRVTPTRSDGCTSCCHMIIVRIVRSGWEH
eukprot:scaffold1928_cov381-Prasinococcus_capsulatus_cf.AAC.19